MTELQTNIKMVCKLIENLKKRKRIDKRNKNMLKTMRSKFVREKFYW